MWIVVNVGCIECGVSSNVVGVFATKEEAEAIANKCDDIFGWREGGDNRFLVFEMQAVGEIAEEYRSELTVSA